MEVIATSGDGHLGGDDFDHVLVQWIVKEVGADVSRAVRVLHAAC